MCCMTSAASFPVQKGTAESCVELKEAAALALPLKANRCKMEVEAMSR